MIKKKIFEIFKIIFIIFMIIIFVFFIIFSVYKNPLFLILYFIIVCILFSSVIARLIVTNILSVIKYSIIDFYEWLRYKLYNNYSPGSLVCFDGIFGEGKTLSAVHHVIENIYNRYDNIIVFDKFRKKWVLQKVMIISNVQLSVPFIDFESLAQIVNLAEKNRQFDLDHNTRTIAIVLGDEFGVQLNSRSFKTNIDPLFLNTLLTCRHHNISFYYTAQRFNLVDALLRQVTSSVIHCHKIWRFQLHNYFDAYQLELATNVNLIVPYKRTGFFVKNKHYDYYDTLACVQELRKKYEQYDMISESEILALQGNDGNIDAVDKLNKKYIKNRKKMR